MLRQAQHERKIFSDSNIRPFTLSLSKGEKRKSRPLLSNFQRASNSLVSDESVRKCFAPFIVRS